MKNDIDVFDDVRRISQSGKKSEDVLLPKSTLWNYIRREIESKGLRPDKRLTDLMNDLSIKFISHLSLTGAQYCNKSGKKTLNIEHLIEALKIMHLDNYITRLSQEECLNEGAMEDTTHGMDTKNLKAMVNSYRKKSGKRKKFVQTPEELEELARQQNIMFEQARNEMNQKYFNQIETKVPEFKDDNEKPEEEENFNGEEEFNEEGEKEIKNEKEEDNQIPNENLLFKKKDEEEEDINFD